MSKNIERVSFLCSFPESLYKTQLDLTKSSTRKNSVLAKAIKEKGNKSFQGGDNIEALHMYNQALVYSNTGEDMAVILANRCRDSNLFIQRLI